MRVAAADSDQPEFLRRNLRRFVLARRILPVERLDHPERRAMARQQIVELRTEARVAKRMRRNRDSAFAVDDFDQPSLLSIRELRSKRRNTSRVTPNSSKWPRLVSASIPLKTFTPNCSVSSA